MGSSPLTRGKLALDRGLTAPKGLIPAHAGKTLGIRRRKRRRAAHPRSRGENTSRLTPSQGIVGSSPLTRGKHLATDTLPGDSGLIPAHAGKTAPRATLAFRARAHPRSRGENLQGLIICARSCGSSPLTRGKLSGGGRAYRPGGLIPAHAGKTGGGRAYRPGGLIPAHAGKTGGGGVSAAQRPAHPRSRGENASRDAHNSEPTGSSPLTRGKRACRRRRFPPERLIPAHAGKT